MKKYLTHLSLVAIALSACGDDKDELIEISTATFSPSCSQVERAPSLLLQCIKPCN